MILTIKQCVIAICLFFLTSPFCKITAQAPLIDSILIRKIFDISLTKGSAYTNLNTLCKKAPARISGSLNAAKAVELSFDMVKQVSDTAWLQETMVPHWERGEPENAYLKVNGVAVNVNLCALGGSIATPNNGITANVIEVNSIAELKELNATFVKGKIVFINQAMDPTLINTFHAYGGCSGIRLHGADEAAKKGAVAVVIRSLTLRNDDFPHTGVMIYKTENKIPAAALSTNDADKLSNTLKDSKDLLFYLKLNCKNFADVKSYNVIGEIKGTEYPNEIILIGGHLDCWDNSEGAHDDGAGCVQSIDVLHIFKELGLKPKRTIRCVLFMNEENGAKGAETYALNAKNKKEKHIVAIESDRGGFAPRGFSVEGNEPIETLCLNKLIAWKDFFEPYLVHLFTKGSGGVDISRLKNQDVALIGFIPDSQRYFDIHHSGDDKFEHVNKRELELGSATIAALVYLFTEYGLK